jgi:two-component system cell cycle sensor histidine kinase/response regulator CckA
MAPLPLDEDNYPAPLVNRRRAGTGPWRVIGLAVFFIVVAVLIVGAGDRIPADLILVFLGLLAVVGVFCLFAIAAGLFRFFCLWTRLCRKGAVPHWRGRSFWESN